MTGDRPIGVGTIGMGSRGTSLGCRIAETSCDTGLTVVAICDRNALRMAEAEAMLRQAAGAQGPGTAMTKWHDSDRLIDDPRAYLPDPNSPERCRTCARDCPYRVAASRKDTSQDDLPARSTWWATSADTAR